MCKSNLDNLRADKVLGTPVTSGAPWLGTNAVESEMQTLKENVPLKSWSSMLEPKSVTFY